MNISVVVNDTENGLVEVRTITNLRICFAKKEVVEGLFKKNRADTYILGEKIIKGYPKATSVMIVYNGKHTYIKRKKDNWVIS